MRWVHYCLVAMVVPAIPTTVFAQDGKYTVSINGQTFDLVGRGAVNSDAVWLFDKQATKVIFVCWENPEPVFSKEMELVQHAVQASWQSSSELRFLGWGKCAKSSKGIRIFIKDDAAEGPRVKDFGRKIDGVENGMILDFTFTQWKPACKQGPVATWISRIAVHEFGHAIGLRHEQDRDDTLGEQCKKLKTGPNPDLILTPYDSQSIMNYCWCDANSTLSKFDIAAVQMLYGKQ